MKPHRGSTIEILGIVSLVLFPLWPISLALGILAWNMAKVDLRKMQVRKMHSAGRQKTNIGRSCGIASVIIASLLAIITFAYIINLLRQPAAAEPSANGRLREANPLAKKPLEHIYSVGEAVRLQDLTFTVIEFQQNFTSRYAYEKPLSGDDAFVRVRVSFLNTSKRKLRVDDAGMQMEDATGAKHFTADVNGLDNQLGTVMLSPGQEVSGNVAFEVKKGSKKLLLHYGGGIAGGEVVIELSERKY